jgi:spore germination protein YaaH
MIRGLLRFVAFSAMVYVSACSTAVEVEPGPDDREVPEARMETAAYHPYWAASAWSRYDMDLVDILFFFDLPISPSGTIEDRRGWPHAWFDLIAAAESADTPIHVTVSILDAHVFRSVFSTPSHVQTLEETLVDLSASGSVSGLHLDVELFEPVSDLERNAFTDLVQRLSVRLKNGRPDFQLSIFLTATDPADAYDDQALAAAADFVIIQAYDLHWLTSPTAGPVAPLHGWGDRNWGAILARAEQNGIPREKMLFSVPYYGYEWPTVDSLPGAATRGPGRLTTYAPSLAGVPAARDRAIMNGMQRDPVSGSPWYAFQDSTGWTQGWYEDATSLAQKYDFIHQEALRGVAIFPYAYGDATLESALRDARMLQIP